MKSFFTMAGGLSTHLGASAEYFAVFGAVVASYLALKVSCSVLCGLKTFVLGSGVNLKKFGEWAVVTGATDGIGKAYAQQLAAKGLSIVLVSRSPEKLEDVATEIENKYKVKTKTVAVDFTSVDIYDKVKSAIEGLEIGTLVNNVGMGYDHPEYLCGVSEKKLADLININIVSVTMMTRLVLPGMAERKRGAVINISSASGAVPTPLLTAYSASKAYVDFFSRGLQQEYASKGILFQSVMPYFVATKLSKIRRANLFVPTPTTFVGQALKSVGQTSRTFGCLSHALQGYVITRVLPEWLVAMVTLRQMKTVRAIAHKKAQKRQ